MDVPVLPAGLVLQGIHIPKFSLFLYFKKMYLVHMGFHNPFSSPVPGQSQKLILIKCENHTGFPGSPRQETQPIGWLSRFSPETFFMNSRKASTVLSESHGWSATKNT